MRFRNRFITDPGLLCSIIFTAAFFIVVFAMQPQICQSQPLAQQSAQPPENSQPDQATAKDVVVTGTIIKDGSNFVLRDQAGIVYQLDAQEKVQPYEGKSVKIAGRLDAETKLLHVETIEELNA